MRTPRNWHLIALVAALLSVTWNVLPADNVEQLPPILIWSLYPLIFVSQYAASLPFGGLHNNPPALLFVSLAAALNAFLYGAMARVTAWGQRPVRSGA